MLNFTQSKWIWAADNAKKCDRVVFRRAFTSEKPPKRATVCVCARDRFNLFVNGKVVLLGASGARSVDIAKFLVKGENVLGFDCLYYGVAANGYNPPQTSGLIVASEDLGLYSDKEFRVWRPHGENAEFRPSGRYWGFDVYTDGSRGELGGVFEAGFGSTLFEAATEGEYGDKTEEEENLDCVYDGVIKVKKMSKTTEGVTNTYVFDIGEETTFYPVIELSAMGTERVEMKSDRYLTAGEWGSADVFTGTRGVYICRNGIQNYASPMPFRGSALVITAPATVTVRTVDLRVVKFPVRRALRVDYDGGVEKLLDKCDGTMRACMDGGLVDNADRDRGCDLLAISLFARSALCMYDDSVLPLVRHTLRKAIGDGRVLQNNAGSPFAEERPVSSLLFCSRLGAPAAYYLRTGDAECIKSLFTPLCDYLLRWQFVGDKLCSRADGSRADAGYNEDTHLIETCLYYSAAKFLASLSQATENYEYEGELRRRAASIEESFDGLYYKGGYYSSGEVCDERANALAVLTGLAAAHESKLRDALCSCHNASPAFEGFVIEALGKIGCPAEACARLNRRFSGLTESESPVLPEYFYRAGSACSTRSVTPVTAFVCGVSGLAYSDVKKVSVRLPHGCGDLRAEIPAGDGAIRLTVKAGSATVENSTGTDVQVRTLTETVQVGKGKSKFAL